MDRHLSSFPVVPAAAGSGGPYHAKLPHIHLQFVTAEQQEGPKLANKTFVEIAAEKVGYGLAMAEDVAGSVKSAIGSAAEALTNSPAVTAVKKAVKNAAGTTPTKKAVKKPPPKKSPAKKAVPKKAAKKLPRKPAKKAIRSRR
jgi:hypothetical protein